MRILAAILAAGLVACASGTSRREPREDRPDDAAAGDAAPGDPFQADDSPGDPGGDAVAGDPWTGPRPEDGWVPPTPTRSLTWVRNNEMFLSGLVPSMGAPPADWVNEYFDDFHATSAHLWMTGLPTEIAGWAAAANPDFRFVTWVKNDGTPAGNPDVIGDIGADMPGRIGYQVGDEPGLDGTGMDEMVEIEHGIDAIRVADPNGFIIVNFTHRADDLDAILHYFGDVIEGDIFSYDSYTQSQSTYEHLERYREFGLLYNRPYWRYLKSYYSDSGDDIQTTDMRWNAFVGLVYGYTGHTWFIYQISTNPDLTPALFATQNDFAAAKTELWSVAAQLNSEMLNLGRCITQLTSTDVRYIALLDYLQPDGTENWDIGAGGNPYIVNLGPGEDETWFDFLVGFFRDDAGEFYVMLQNVRHENGSFPVGGNLPGVVHVQFDFSDGAPTMADDHLLVLNKVTGAVEELPLVVTGDDQAYLDVEIPAGDVILFKYDTGVPFALQTL